MSQRPKIAIATKCALLFLAFSVFAWGLHAKLSLYQAAQNPSTATVAKLSTEKRSAQTMASLEKAVKPDSTWETVKLISLAVSLQMIAIPSFRFHQVEVSLCRSCRCDLQGPDIMHRPPPTLS
jgi:hypothetical protein